MARRRGRRGRLPLFIVSSKKTILAVVISALVFSVAWVAGRMVLPTAAQPGPLAGQVVYIDPGHGGIDPGACGREVLEKDVVLNVALYLGVRLERDGAKVVYSRTGDYDLQTDDKDDVEERIRLIKSTGATIVISLHANAFTDSSEWGAQTFFNSSKNKENKRLAELIQARLKEKTETPREASAKLEHFILNHSNVPSATVELGFLSNPREEGLLGSHSYQQDLAECIRQAIREFVGGGLGEV
ncbi:MAG: N-acetylmuramoyl-L-alanine amidase family protein [Bacillota bacterium]